MRKQGNRGSFRQVMNRVWLLLLILWILIIYGHSLTPADLSSRESGLVMEQLLNILHILGSDGGWVTEHIVRKSAHFLEYTLFGLLLMQNFHVLWNSASWNISRPRKGAGEKFLPLILAVLAVPFCDETIQLFVSGRAGQISDVWLDISGTVCGILLREAAVFPIHYLAGRNRPRHRRWKP